MLRNREKLSFVTADALRLAFPSPHKCTELEDCERLTLVWCGLGREGTPLTFTLTELTVPLNTATVHSFLLIVDGAGVQLTVGRAPVAQCLGHVWVPT